MWKFEKLKDKYPEVYELECQKCKKKNYKSFKEDFHCYPCKEDTCKLTKSLEAGVQDSKKLRNAILVKPTFSGFEKYTSTCLLHVGISNSKGEVYNFFNAVKCDKFWDEAIGIELITKEKKFDEDVVKKFDALTKKHFEDEKKRLQEEERYHQLDNNCYDYAIRFVNKNKDNKNLILGGEKFDKLGFAKKFVEPLINAVEAYIDAFKKRTFFWCDGCTKKDLIPNDRFKCLECDIDLCKKCFACKKEVKNHKCTHKMQEM